MNRRDSVTDTLRTLAFEYDLPYPALKKLLELSEASEHDPDVPLTPRVLTLYEHVLTSLGYNEPLPLA
jgi:hypothetical protein